MQLPDFIKSTFKQQHQQVYGSSREAVLNRDLVLNTETNYGTPFKTLLVTSKTITISKDVQGKVTGQNSGLAEYSKSDLIKGLTK
jgi:hypothetical protein